MKEILAWKPIGLEAVDHQLIDDQQAETVNVGRACTSCRAATRRRLADGAVRRRHRPRSRWRAAQEFVALADGREGLRRGPDRGREERAGGRQQRGPLVDPRERPRLDRVPARRQGPLARLGGLRRAARPGRRLRARPAGALRRARAEGRDLRPPRRGLHPLPDQLRPAHRRRAAELPRVHGGGGRPGRPLRRHALRRARRRPAARRAAGEAVRAAADEGHARVQGHLGPGRGR